MQNKKQTILIVDDTQLNRMVLCDMLEEDYNLIEAEDGVEALSYIGKSSGLIDLIILDNFMPNMSGLELMEIISSNPWLKKIPVIMISSDSNIEFVDRAYELGVADFFFKPFNEAIVLHRVRYTLNNYMRHNQEIYNTLHSVSDKLFAVMQINLLDDTCLIIETSEVKELWGKDVSTKASDIFRQFVAMGYIHPDDEEKFLEFTDINHIKDTFLQGILKMHMRYRRKYNGQYHWALMEITSAMDYSVNHPMVTLFSKDIQSSIEEQNKVIENISNIAVSSDYCNLSKNFFYHTENAHYFSNELKEIDTITQMVDCVAAHIPVEEDREKFIQILQPDNLINEYKKGNRLVTIEHLYNAPNKQLQLYKTTVQMINNTFTKDIEAICFTENISANYIHHRIEESLYDREYLFIGVLDVQRNNLYIHKTDGYITLDEGSCEEYTSIQNMILEKYIPNNTKEAFEEMSSPNTILDKLKITDSYEFNFDCMDDNGMPISMQFVYRYLEKKYGIISCMVKNISEMMRMDPITEGLNQKGFERKLQYILEHDQSSTNYSILHFDIKEFKALNEVLGYEDCNQMLKKVYNKLANSKLQPILTARLMADQFVCLVETKKLNHETLSKHCQIELQQGDYPYMVRLHCGIYHIENRQDSVQSMCDKAKIAEEYIENSYAMPYVVYENFMNDMYIKHMKIMNNVAMALKNEEFKVYYQPIYDAKERKIVSAETLVRWINPVEGIISPGDFIPAMEEKGAISQLDLYMTQSVKKFLMDRKEQNKKNVPLSINLSRMDFFNSQMLENLVEMMETSSLETSYFRFEITESAFVDINQINNWALNKLQKFGAKLMIDDFGTGYSSLSNLAEQNFEILKIDMSFVKKIGINKKTEAIIKSIIVMAHEMGVKVVAEGVETEEQLTFLAEKGCDYIQGYYFSKPLPQDEFEKLLDAIE